MDFDSLPWTHPITPLIVILFYITVIWVASPTEACAAQKSSLSASSALNISPLLAPICRNHACSVFGLITGDRNKAERGWLSNVALVHNLLLAGYSMIVLVESLRIQLPAFVESNGWLEFVRR